MMLFKLNIIYWLGLVCIVSLIPDALHHSIKSIKCETEPPYPQLIPWSNGKFKIVSESVDERLGVQTLEEYHVSSPDVKSTYYLTTSSSNNNNNNQQGAAPPPYRVMHLNAHDGLCYTYQPYSCKITKIKDLSESLYDPETQDWNHNVKVPTAFNEFRVYGVRSLWTFAHLQSRTFSRAKMIYSASKQVYRESLLWTVRDEANKLTIKLYFVDSLRGESVLPARGKQSSQSSAIDLDNTRGPTLEMIQIEADDPASGSDAKRLIRTINILSIDYYFETADHLEPPVGFGCFSELINEGRDKNIMKQRQKDIQYASDWTTRDVHIELEVTATKYGSANGGSSSDNNNNGAGFREERVSDTYNVEVALSHVYGPAERNHIELIRRRNTNEDRKIVVNHMLKVVYSIDMRYGTCELAHISDLADQETDYVKAAEAGRSDELYEKVLLQFKNTGLQLDVSLKLFKLTDDLHFVKSKPISEDGPYAIHYYESGATSSDVLKKLIEPKAYDANQVRRARMIWSYIYRDRQVDLKSLTIWVLNEQQNRLLESYQINLIGGREIGLGWPDQAKLFDVSEECYLENEHMKQNRDYAWFQLTYPAPSKALAAIARNEIALKSLFYSNAVDDFTRVPRLELMIEDDSFVIRLLMLDLPTTELVYDKTAGQSLVPASELGDLTYMAADLQHCGHMCRMNYCTVMTYCSRNHACLLSSRPLRPRSTPDEPETDDISEDYNGKSNNNNYKPSPQETIESVFEYNLDGTCDTYKMPASVEKNNLLRRDRLHSKIASLQHQNYGTATLPKQPDEILLPRGETGLTGTEYLSAFFAYKGKLYQHLLDENRSPELLISLSLEDHFYFFIPNRFELESDPLRDLNIYDESQADDADLDDDELNGAGQLNGAGGGGDDDTGVPRFHQGLALYRYNVVAAAAAKQTASINNDASNRVEFRTYTGLSYDQCALACSDSKCGSFSYCNNNAHECILSSVTSTGQARTLGLIEHDPDCFIAQRDFLANFVKFDNIYRPQVSTRTSEASDPSECALACVSETNFRCLSFQFCSVKVVSASLGAKGSKGAATGQCYFQIERHLPGSSQPAMSTGGRSSKQKPQYPIKPDNSGASTTITTCSHYSRSHLADFVRVESRRVSKSIMGKLKTSTFNGLSVFSCAERCANELLDCSGFQFCHSTKAATSKEARECTTIESKVTPKVVSEALQEGDNNNNKKKTDDGDDNSTNSDDNETIIDEQAGGRVLHAGKYLEFDEDCQLFTMRRDSTEAHLRDLAFGGLVKTAREKAAERDSAIASRSSGGLSFFGGFFLYIVVALISTAIGCGAMILKDNSVYVRDRLNWVRTSLGI